MSKAAERPLGRKISPSAPKGRVEAGAGQHFEDRNLMPVKTAEAFVPTPAEPVRMRFKMAGGC